MENQKKYKVSNFKDLCNLANPENIDVLSEDLKNWLKIYVETLELLRLENPELKNLSNSEIAEGSFIWIDDGKNECAGLTFKDKKSGDTIRISNAT